MGGGPPGASGRFNTGSEILPGSFLVPGARHPEEGGREEEKETGMRDQGHSEGSFLPNCPHKQFSTGFLQSKDSSRSWGGRLGWGWGEHCLYSWEFGFTVSSEKRLPLLYN